MCDEQEKVKLQHLGLNINDIAKCSNWFDILDNFTHDLILQISPADARNFPSISNTMGLRHPLLYSRNNKKKKEEKRTYTHTHKIKVNVIDIVVKEDLL